jgi:putative endopeptidase
MSPKIKSITTFSLTILILLLTTGFIMLNGGGSGFDTSQINRSVKPQDNFYEFAVGNWLKNNKIPDEYSRWGSFEKLAEMTNEQIKEILLMASAKQDWEIGSANQKIGDFYATGMDSAQIEKLGIKPLLPELNDIDKIKTKADLIKMIGYLHSRGISVPFGFYATIDSKKSSMNVAELSQGGVSLPDVEYYTKDDARSKEIRENYLVYLKGMLELSGNTPDEAEANAKKIMELETRLAKSSFTRLENRDPEKTYNKMGVEQLSKMTGSFDWDLFFKTLDIKNPGVVVVEQPRFFEGLSGMFNDVSINDWKVYLKWHLLNGAANYLSSDFVNKRFDFYGKFLTGAKVLQPRWKRVLQVSDRFIGELVGESYTDKYFPAESKAKAKQIVDNLLVSMGERINGLEWMSPETKAMALKKLSTFKVKIGYPDKWRDYSSLEIKRDTYLKNVIRAAQWAKKDNLAKINTPVDETEWGMNPQTVNAYYSPNRNEIVFPAAILQHPFFDPNSDDAINYGGMGAVIGHEITHGFDDQGRKYDADGNIKEWWTKEDGEKFQERADKLAAQYDGYNAIENFNVDGKLTIGENIADLGGLTVSYNAFKKTEQYKKGEMIDGFTPSQRFFLSWAQVWKNNIRDENLKLRLKTDVHSPGKYRVLGPLANMPEFFEAFSVKEGDAMRNSGDKLVKIW